MTTAPALTVDKPRLLPAKKKPYPFMLGGIAATIAASITVSDIESHDKLVTDQPTASVGFDQGQVAGSEVEAVHGILSTIANDAFFGI